MTVLTPCLVGWVVGFDQESKHHDPANSRLTQTRLVWRQHKPPELRRPYVSRRRQIHCGDAVAAGPGWVSTDGNFVTARSLRALVLTAEAGAEQLEAAPLFPWIPSQLRAIAEHWSRFDEPVWEALKHWPGDANPEALT